MNQILKLFKRDWPYFLIIIIVFVLSAMAGYNIPEFAPQYTDTFKKIIIERFGEIAKLLKNSPLYIQIGLIFMNNITASVTSILLGLTMLPFLPLLPLLGNGLIIGFVQKLSEMEGLSTSRFYLSLLPHGIFELPAFFIAVFLGFRLSLIPYRLFFHYLQKKEYRPFFKEFLTDLRYYIPLMVVLLVIAAIIEMSVSPLILGKEKIL